MIASNEARPRADVLGLGEVLDYCALRAVAPMLIALSRLLQFARGPALLDRVLAFDVRLGAGVAHAKAAQLDVQALARKAQHFCG